MGNAIITENVGEGLYKAKPVYNVVRLEQERDRLLAQNETYWRILADAWVSLRALRKDRQAAAETLSALIALWKAALDEKINPPTTPVVPPDALPGGLNPDTGEPYLPSERSDALAEALADRVNAERAKAGFGALAMPNRLPLLVTARLDRITANADHETAQTLLARLAEQDADGERVTDRWQRLHMDMPAVQITEMLAVGKDTTDAVADAWMRDPDTRAALLDPDATLLGLAYRHEPSFPGGHLWGGATVNPHAAPDGNSTFFAGAVGQDLLAQVLAQAGADAAAAVSGSGGGGGTWGETWQANTFYGIGQIVLGTRPNNGSSVLVRNYSRYGRSGSEQPQWPPVGRAVGDGQITWTVLEIILPEPVIHSILTYYGPGA